MATPISRSPVPVAPPRGCAAGASRWIVVAAWACIGLTSLPGCRSVDNAQVDLLERELRQQEDYIYELEDYLMEYSEKLRQARMMCNSQPMEVTETAKQKKSTLREPELIDDPPRSRAKPITSEPAVEAPAAEPAAATEPLPSPASPPPAEPKPEPAKMEAPDVEIGDPGAALPWRKLSPVASTPDVEKAPTPGDAREDDATTANPAPAGEEAPPFLPDPVDYQVDADAPTEPLAEIPAEEAPQFAAPAEAPELVAPSLPPIADAVRTTAVHLEIRQVFTQPSAEDPARPGSLLVVVEAINALGEPVDADGTASLMIMASDEAGVEHRVDRWDFTAQETRAAWQSSRLGDGLHLQLPLDAAELPTGRLELWARLVGGGEDQKLLAKLPFDVAELVAFDKAMATADAAPREVAAIERPPVAEQAPRVASKPEPAAESLPAPTWRTATQAVGDAKPPAGGESGGKGWVAKPQPPTITR